MKFVALVKGTPLFCQEIHDIRSMSPLLFIVLYIRSENMAHNILSSELVSHMGSIIKYLERLTIFATYPLAFLTCFTNKCVDESGYHHESFPNNVSFTSQ